MAWLRTDGLGHPLLSPENMVFFAYSAFTLRPLRLRALSLKDFSRREC
jgi:hypothetical protein